MTEELCILILFSMIFLHVVEDFHLQGILAQMKQKKYWADKPKKYKYDYIAALIAHSFSWSFMIMIPIYILSFKFNINITSAFIVNMLNCTMHFIVDDLKANKLKINLIQDQSIHLIQILITWLILIVPE